MHQGVLRAANVKLPRFDMPSPWFTRTEVTTAVVLIIVTYQRVCGQDIRQHKMSTCALEARHCSSLLGCFHSLIGTVLQLAHRYPRTVSTELCPTMEMWK